MRERTKRWKQEHPEWQIAYYEKLKVRYATDPEFRKYKNRHSSATYHNVKKHDAEYIQRMYEAKREYVQNNKDKYAKWVADYRFKKYRAAANHTEFDALVVAEAYNLAKLRASCTGIKWHVDHIVPVRSASVCGLHNAFNLQVIPAADNLRKGNTFDPDDAVSPYRAQGTSHD
jgi:hypothetical protein